MSVCCEVDSGQASGGETADPAATELAATLDAEEAELLDRALRIASGLEPGTEDAQRRVVQLLLEHHADLEVLVSAILAPLLWHDRLSEADLARDFGKGFAALSARIAPPTPRGRAWDRWTTGTGRQDGPVSGCLCALVPELAWRAHELEVSAADGHANNEALARETLAQAAPLADRLGLRCLRRRLEDASFRVLEPEAHERLLRELAPRLREDNACLERLGADVGRLLARNGLAGRVEKRVKGLYSLDQKMRRTHRTLNEVTDRLGLRIIVPSTADCYRVLDALHAQYPPLASTFDDYIASPKASGYQSLHTCVRLPAELSRRLVETQIRSEEMHTAAELGMAAHWRYKNVQKRRARDDENRRRATPFCASCPG